MPNALIVGGATWDTIIHLDRLPEPRPGTLFSRESYETVGSTGAGKALNLNRLGFDLTFHAMIGDDEPGQAVLCTISSSRHSPSPVLTVAKAMVQHYRKKPWPSPTNWARFRCGHGRRSTIQLIMP